MANRTTRPFFNKEMWKKTGIITLITLKWMIILGFIVGFLAAGAAFGYVTALVKDEPVRSKDMITKQMEENSLTGFVYFNDDTPVGQLRSDEDRRLAALQDIPQKLKDAVLAIEDNDFNKHHGINIKATLRAVLQKLKHDDVQTGGSTITQQLARRVFLTLDKDDGRKAKEIFLSLRLERMMSKDEILLAYLNKIPYGNGSNGYNLYGIKAAAKSIFNLDDLNELSIAQCAYLAGLPQQPSVFSAYTSKGEFDADGFKRAMTRQKLVLKRMLEENKITDAQYQEALQVDLKPTLSAPRKKAYATYPWLMLDAERQAADVLVRQQFPNLTLDTEAKQNAYNEALKDVHSEILHGGYRIYTTIDKTIYDSMHDIGENNDNFAKYDEKRGLEQIGAVMLDNRSGAILGMLEGRDFYAEQLNHATQAFRQPGSTMKPIAAYIPALEKGAIQPATAIDDIPVILKDGQKGWHIPQNWDTDYHGLITARVALNKSYNIPAIKLFLNQVGIPTAWDYARKMGITSLTKEDNNAQTGVIGGLTKGTSVEELTNAYATMANKGVFNDAYMIRKIVDANGKTIYEHEMKPSTVFSEETAYLITDMMRTVIDSPVGAATATDMKQKFKYWGKIPIVGKTGSTQDDTDAWFEGYSPDITLGVWAGYDSPKFRLRDTPTGTQRAKEIWADIMNAAAEKKPDLFPTKAFERPDNIVEMTVSNLSGKLPNDLTTESNHNVTDLFNKKYIPTQEDDVMVKMKIISYNGMNYIPKPETPPDMLEEKVVIRRQESIKQLLDKIKEVMQQLPEGDRKSIDGFIPLDVDNDAPDEVDPRADDGAVPSAPTGTVLSRNGSEIKISFAASSSPDVVGYRLYRSTGHGPFQRVNGKVVLAGQDTAFTDTAAAGAQNGYYVTAVDVVGKESKAGQAVFMDGTSQDILMFPPLTGDGGTSPGPSALGTGKAGSPTAPSGLAAQMKGLALQLTWKANPAKQQVKKYDVYYSDKENGTYRKLGSTSGTEFQYYAAFYDGFYVVTAENAAGESKPSAPIPYKAVSPSPHP